MEGLTALLPIALVFFGVFAFTGLVSKLKQSQQAGKGKSVGIKPGPEPVYGEQPFQTMKSPVSEGASPAPFARSYETDRRGWDSLSEFHEGEDPCHDDMTPIAPETAEQPKPYADRNAQEIIKGFVIGEILARRRQRQNWQ